METDENPKIPDISLAEVKLNIDEKIANKELLEIFGSEEEAEKAMKMLEDIISYSQSDEFRIYG